MCTFSYENGECLDCSTRRWERESQEFNRQFQAKLARMESASDNIRLAALGVNDWNLHRMRQNFGWESSLPPGW